MCAVCEFDTGERVNSVFLLWHIHSFDSGEDNEKLIGVYASESDAVAARNRMKVRPAFSSFPSGFQIDEYEIGRDNWEEGSSFATFPLVTI
jgi:hypothetical protein